MPTTEHRIILVLGGIILGSACPDRPASGAETGELHVLRASADTVRSVAFSPDGKALATAGYDNVVRLWDVASGQQRATLSGHRERLLSLAFSPDGRMLASGGTDAVKLWDVSSGRERATFDDRNVLAVTFSPDGKRLATGGEGDGAVKLREYASGRLRATLSGVPGDDVVFALAFSPDGRVLAAATLDMQTEPSLDLRVVRSGNGTTLTLWDTTAEPGPRPIRRVERITEIVWTVAFSPDGRTLAAGTSEGRLRTWGVATGEEHPPIRAHRKTVHGVAYSPDGKTIATGSLDKTVCLWDASTGALLATFRGHTNAVKCVAFSPDGRTIASGSWDDTARLWDASARPAPEPPRDRPDVIPKEPADAGEVVAAIEGLHGKVYRDSKRAGMPVILIHLRDIDLTDAQLSRLRLEMLPDLQNLDLTGTEVTDAGMVSLAGLVHLRGLNLVGTLVTDAGLVHLRRLTNLGSLGLPEGVTDAGLRHFEDMTDLRDLDLTRTQVTDAGLVHLNGLKKLRTLLLSTQITDAGIERLRRTLPGVKVRQ
jgi:hypothetical protein